jgi:hypothetical protein
MNAKPTAATKSQLARAYKVHLKTFQAWLLKVPNLELTPNQRTLTPKQVRLIYEHLDPP